MYTVYTYKCMVLANPRCRVCCSMKQRINAAIFKKEGNTAQAGILTFRMHSGQYFSKSYILNP
jgi:hypothetical protein